MRTTVLSSLLCLASFAGPAAGNMIYQYDAGTLDTGVGEASSAWDFYALNRFERQAGGREVYQIQAAFYPHMLSGYAFQAIVWNDSGKAGDIADARVVTSVDAVATGSGMRWVTVDIPMTNVTPVFFVGVYVSHIDFPMALDWHGWAPGRSYGGGSPTPPSNLNGLAGNPDHGWNESFGIKGVYPIRALATDEPSRIVPEPMTAWLLILGSIPMCRRRR